MFAHFSGGRLPYLSPGATLGAVAALGFAVTAAESDALAAVVGSVYGGRE